MKSFIIFSIAIMVVIFSCNMPVSNQGTSVRFDSVAKVNLIKDSTLEKISADELQQLLNLIDLAKQKHSQNLYDKCTNSENMLCVYADTVSNSITVIYRVDVIETVPPRNLQQYVESVRLMENKEELVKDYVSKNTTYKKVAHDERRYRYDINYEYKHLYFKVDRDLETYHLSLPPVFTKHPWSSDATLTQEDEVCFYADLETRALYDGNVAHSSSVDEWGDFRSENYETKYRYVNYRNYYSSPNFSIERNGKIHGPRELFYMVNDDFKEGLKIIKDLNLGG